MKWKHTKAPASPWQTFPSIGSTLRYPTRQPLFPDCADTPPHPESSCSRQWPPAWLCRVYRHRCTYRTARGWYTWWLLRRRRRGDGRNSRGQTFRPRILLHVSQNSAFAPWLMVNWHATLCFRFERACYVPGRGFCHLWRLELLQWAHHPQHNRSLLPSRQRWSRDLGPWFAVVGQGLGIVWVYSPGILDKQ